MGAGAEAAAGGGGGGGGGGAVTTAVGFDVAEAFPAAFVAVTTTFSVLPTSADATTRDEAVAPAMFVQPVPAVVQRRQRKAYVIGAVPLHVPLVAVRVLPTCAVPLIVGSAVLLGGVAAITNGAALADPANADASRTATSAVRARRPVRGAAPHMGRLSERRGRRQIPRKSGWSIGKKSSGRATAASRLHAYTFRRQKRKPSGKNASAATYGASATRRRSFSSTRVGPWPTKARACFTSRP